MTSPSRCSRHSLTAPSPAAPAQRLPAAPTPRTEQTTPPSGARSSPRSAPRRPPRVARPHTTRSQGVVGVLDLRQRRRVAEARFVLIREPGRFRGSVAAPGVAGAGDLGDVLLAEGPLGAVDHVAQLARIDKQDLPCPVHFSAVTGPLVLGKEPHAHRNPG